MPVINVPSEGPGPARYTLTATVPLLFTAAQWTQQVAASGLDVVPAVLIFDQSGELVARLEGPDVVVP